MELSRGNNGRRLEQIDEVGPLVVILASVQSSFISGANYRLDGGGDGTVRDRSETYLTRLHPFGGDRET